MNDETVVDDNNIEIPRSEDAPTPTAPPLDITVCSRREAVRLLTEAEEKGTPFDCVISIDDANWCTNEFGCAKIAGIREEIRRRMGERALFLDFVDAISYDPMHILALGPRVEHITTIREFIDNQKPHARILIHCVAGISRSTATAVIALERRGMQREAALAHVHKIRRIAQPNQIMLALANAS